MRVEWDGWTCGLKFVKETSPVGFSYQYPDGKFHFFQSNKAKVPSTTTDFPISIGLRSRWKGEVFSGTYKVFLYLVCNLQYLTSLIRLPHLKIILNGATRFSTFRTYQSKRQDNLWTFVETYLTIGERKGGKCMATNLRIEKLFVEKFFKRRCFKYFSSFN